MGLVAATLAAENSLIKTTHDLAANLLFTCLFSSSLMFQ